MPRAAEVWPRTAGPVFCVSPPIRLCVAAGLPWRRFRRQETRVAHNADFFPAPAGSTQSRRLQSTVHLAICRRCIVLAPAHRGGLAGGWAQRTLPHRFGGAEPTHTPGRSRGFRRHDPMGRGLRGACRAARRGFGFGG